jgi:signal transduction histidine kinase
MSDEHGSRSGLQSAIGDFACVEDAVVVGSRAGVVEWGNRGWRRLTQGADETGEKPLGTLLERYGVEPAAVDWVARRFLAGRPSELELPIQEPGGARRWLHVSLEPLRDESGEVAHFVAVARDVTAARAGEPELAIEAVDLSELAVDCAHELQPELGDLVAFDLSLPADLPHVYADREKLAALVRHLLRRGREAIGDMWGNLTLTTGMLGVGLGPLYRGDPAAGLPLGPFAFLEVHDTGPTSEDEARARLREPFLPARPPARGWRLPTGEALLRALDGAAAWETERWWGTSVVLLLPA